MRNSYEVAQGVCPDSIYEGLDGVGLVKNSMLIYGHMKDKVTFVIHPLNHSMNMKVLEHVNECTGPLDDEDKEDQGLQMQMFHG
ncbi:hypothetical protein JHK82_033545 [Glycine max]|nr:hypothetical protein JHK85_034261 [Glycine max]KAG4985940.1 hypothetical protein JHK86_033631 [Glycine max]KAG5119125.1 hypothetical protein JHK82_033545 [Glycine max]KAG5140113.1 hypothetical protein JHK84_033881 [Glycine max]